MNTDDYTQTLWSVIAQERVYPYPLRVQDRERLFAEWMDANPEAVAEMEALALEIGDRGEPVSVQRLFEVERWEGKAVQVGIPYIDMQGKRRRYKVNHNDRSLFGRWLQSKHPEINVRLRRSMFDGEAGR